MCLPTNASASGLSSAWCDASCPLAGSTSASGAAAARPSRAARDQVVPAGRGRKELVGADAEGVRDGDEPLEIEPSFLVLDRGQVGDRDRQARRKVLERPAFLFADFPNRWPKGAGQRNR